MELINVKAAQCADRTVEIGQISGSNVWIPTHWKQECDASGAVKAALDLVSMMSPAARESSWIISSATKDLWDQPRVDSKSHAEGRAFDLAPMYNEDIIMPDQQSASITGLAWNMILLSSLISATEAGILFFVEGDHLHIELGKAPTAPGLILCVWTIAPWYPWTKFISQDPLLKDLIGTAWIFSARPLAFIGPCEPVRSYMRAVLDNTSQQIVDPKMYLDMI